MNQGIILKGSEQSLKKRKENYALKKSLSKKARKVIEKGVEEIMALPPLTELTRIGARLMLQSALEEEVTPWIKEGEGCGIIVSIKTFENKALRRICRNYLTSSVAPSSVITWQCWRERKEDAPATERFCMYDGEVFTKSPRKN